MNSVSEFVYTYNYTQPWKEDQFWPERCWEQLFPAEREGARTHGHGDEAASSAVHIHADTENTAPGCGNVLPRLVLARIVT